MFSRSRNNSRVNLLAAAAAEAPATPPPPPPPPPPHPDVWTAPAVSYFIRSPWEWVMSSIATEGMTQVNTPVELPSEKQPKVQPHVEATPATRRRRIAAKKLKGPATLKMELVHPVTGHIEYAVHGTSAALDGMEDKDELVRTLQRCRCENLNLSPPAVLISWDVTSDECVNVVGKNLPMVPENNDQKVYAVLKEPMGSQGRGIYFVSSAEEIFAIIDEHHMRAKNEPDFLDNLIAVKGRIPSWVLQAEVSPSLLIKGRRKFHIRTYVVILEKLAHQDLLDLYIFNRHEVRIAGTPIPENDTERNPISHITNGALSNLTERVLLHDVDELTSLDLQAKTEIFVAETFGKHLLPDMARRINLSASQDTGTSGLIRKFAIAGLDIMVTEENRIYLLEVNANPAAPPESTVSDSFKEHLKGFLHNLVDLVVGKPSSEFINVQDILVREGLVG